MSDMIVSKAANRVPTSFSLSDEQFDKLCEVARQILIQSEEYQRFLDDLK
jgi:hypothetical protein